MTIKLKVVWIDDTPDRAAVWEEGLSSGHLRNTPVKAELDVIEVTSELLDDLDVQVKSWRKAPPNLIILDHDFSKVAKRLFAHHGSALAHLLRIQLPKTPIVCVSGQSINSTEFDYEDLSEYTYIFEINKIHLEENLEMLFAIAEDFPLLCFSSRKSARQAVVAALKTPSADQSSLLSILPEEFESTRVHGTSPHRIARWVLNVMMSREGFLCDSLEAATFLGLSEESFRAKVKALFVDALYGGPFAISHRPLWWISTLTDVLYAKFPDLAAFSSQEAGRRLPKIVESDFSRCGVTDKHSPAPDVVAFTDGTKTERKPVRHDFTEPLSEEASAVLGFSTQLRIRNPRRER